MKPPPSIAGIFHSREIDVDITVVITRSRGALGTFTCHGTAVTELEEAPVPIALTALTLNVWVTPLAKPVTVAVVSVETPSAKTVQSLFVSEEYSTR